MRTLAGPVLFALTLAALPHAARAQDDTAAIRAAVCPARGHCHLDFVLRAGRGAGASLAVVRVRAGRILCNGEGPERGYRDWLVAIRPNGARRLRELARGDVPCLEWQLSSWTYEHGELVFHYGGMGAPPSSDTDLRPMAVHLRPWPLTVVRAFIGTDTMAPPELPPTGPLFHLTME